MRLFQQLDEEQDAKLRRLAASAVFLLVLGSAAFADYSYDASFSVPGLFSHKALLSPDFKTAVKAAEPWMNPIITPEEYAAIDWVKANTRERTVFVSDIFGGELLMGLSLREGTEGGDWAIIPNVTQRMADMDRFYKSKDAEEARQIAKQYGAEYVWVPNRQVFAGYGWVPVEEEKFAPEFFQLVFENRTRIYKVIQ